MLSTALLVALETVPVVDIDNTIFLQGILFLGLFLLLNTFLFKPWLEVRDRRERKIGGAFDDAKKLQAAALAAQDDYDARLAAARDAAMSERSDRRRDAETQEAKVVGSARSEAAATIAARKREISIEIDSARSSLQQGIAPLADDITAHILGRRA